MTRDTAHGADILRVPRARSSMPRGLYNANPPIFSANGLRTSAEEGSTNGDRPDNQAGTGDLREEDHDVFAQGLESVGQPGRMQQLEARVERHERTVQRMKGVGGAFSVLFTAFHVVMDMMKH